MNFTSKQKEICTRWEMLVSFLDNKCIFAYLIFSGSKMAICISLIFCGAKSVGAGMRSLYSGDRVVDRPGSIYTPVAKCRILKRNLEDFYSRYNCCCVCPRCPSVIFKTEPCMKYAVKSGKVQEVCRVLYDWEAIVTFQIEPWMEYNIL